MLYEATNYKVGGGSPDVLINKFKRGDKSQILAARISGKLKSNFSTAPVEKNEDGSPKASATANALHLSESIGSSNVIVVADTDFLTDQASVVSQNLFGAKIVSMINDNLTFAVNVIENLQGSSDLISLRSRGKFTRPFTKVQAIEREAEERFRNEEKTFQTTITSANQRLAQIQGGEEGADKKKEQVFNSALLDEIKAIREQRAEAQERLREVRKNLRLDKERLGQWLFVLNTFAVPLCLIFLVFYLQRRKQ